jgi:hypothetical protein
MRHAKRAMPQPPPATGKAFLFKGNRPRRLTAEGREVGRSGKAAQEPDSLLPEESRVAGGNAFNVPICRPKSGPAPRA